MPTVKQVLQRFHHHFCEQTVTWVAVRNASHLTVDEVLTVWSKAAVLTTLKKHAINKLEKYHVDWLLLKKNRGRVSASQQQRESQYQQDIEHVFDIAHAEALTTIKILEDRQFLNDQRNERKMYMSVEDKELAQKQERAKRRQTAEEDRRKKAAATSALETVSANVVDIRSDSSCESENSEDNFEPRQKSLTSAAKEPTMKPETSHLFTKHVTSALDRNKISDREAVRLMVPLAAAMGHDPSSFPLSRSTIRRKRMKGRVEQDEAVRAEFHPECSLVIHWDGKILPEIVGAGHVDRLPVLVSGEGVDKLLGVPKLPAGTAKYAANAVFSMIERWNITDKVQAMSFDTTAVNTGQKNGACVQLECMLGRDLLWLACRHHVLEVMLAKVFSLCFGPSSGPDIAIFKRFKPTWNAIVHDNYQVLEVKPADKELRETTVAFLNDPKVKDLQLRDDYQELVELTLLVLGQTPQEIHWRAPGAIHHARWMAKLLYAIKIYLFRGQTDVFKLTKKEETAIERFVHFGAMLYTMPWMKAMMAAESPGGDLQLWKDLEKYQVFDQQISIAGRKVLEQHSWYLSDELVGLALFSDNVSVEEKAKIVAGLSKEPGDRNVRGNATRISSQASLGDFASRRTMELFSRLQIPDTFLAQQPQDWCHNEAYQRGRKRIKALRVVNDTAERGVKLFEEYNQIITRDEEEKQLLLQVVEANRKAIPTETTKKAAVAAVSD